MNDKPLKANNTMTSSGYIPQRQTKQEWTELQKHLSGFPNVKDMQTNNKI